MKSLILKCISCAPSRRASVLFAAATAAMLGASAGLTRASTILTDGNSSVALTSTAVTQWTVGTTNQLDQEEFFYRVGNSGGQSPLSSLTPNTIKTLDTNSNGLNDTAKITYGSSSGFQVVVTYSLTGGATGSGSSDLGETIKVSNEGMSSQTFHLFEYTNFNLGGSTSGQVVTITGGNTATDVGNGVDAQIVVSPKPSEYGASNTAASPDLLSSISSSSKAYTLKDVASAPSGDGESAFEWDLNIGCGSTCVISIDKDLKGTPVVVVPEPVGGAIALLGLGGLFMGRPRRSGLAI